MCPSHFCRVRVTSPSSQSHLKFCRVRVRVMTWSSQSRVTKIIESLRVNVESHNISRFFYNIFLLQNGARYVKKWCPTCCEMAPDKLENGVQCCFNKFHCRLFLCKFSQFAFYLSVSTLTHFKNLSQPCYNCFSLC